MIEKDVELKNLTTFKIGGKISEIIFPTDAKEMVEICELVDEDIKVFGNLSNTLVSTSGYDGKIIITSKMDNIEVNNNRVRVEAGIKGPKLAQMLCECGLSGLEFMIGFPGSLGGNVCMNASANSQCVSDKLLNVTCWSKKKGIHVLSNEEMKFAYRKSICQEENIIVLSAEFVLEEKKSDIILEQMKKNLEFRKTHQPSLAFPNCGSIFKNPQGYSAGKLLDDAGVKMLTFGGAKVWENHANFIVNSGGATSEDVLNLMCKMYTKVKEQFEIELEPEIKYLGNKNVREVELCKKLNIK